MFSAIFSLKIATTWTKTIDDQSRTQYLIKKAIQDFLIDDCSFQRKIIFFIFFRFLYHEVLKKFWICNEYILLWIAKTNIHQGYINSWSWTFRFCFLLGGKFNYEQNDVILSKCFSKWGTFQITQWERAKIFLNVKLQICFENGIRVNEFIVLFSFE